MAGRGRRLSLVFKEFKNLVEKIELRWRIFLAQTLYQALWSTVEGRGEECF